MTVLNQLNTMNLGQMKDVVFSSGVARVTREIERVEQNIFYVHDFSSGWLTAELNLNDAIKFCKGEIKPIDLLWE